MSPPKLEDLLRQGAAIRPRRAARRVQDHLPEVDGRAVERGGREVVSWVQAHLPRPEPRRKIDTTAVFWPTFLAAAGAGAAFWWWTSWSRGRAEAERDRLGGEEGAAHPQDILAHAPSPPETAGPDDQAPPPSVAPEAVMAHAPPPPEADADAPRTPKGKLKKVKPVVAPKAEEALRRNLAVQASGDGEPAPRTPSRKAAK